MKNNKNMNTRSKSSLFTLCAALLVILSFSACQNFVQSIDLPINSVNDDMLNTKSELPFLITGIRVQYCNCLGQLGVLSGGLSDELIFTLDIKGATYPQYDEIESGVINLNNTSVDNCLNAVGQLRITADTLLERINRIKFEEADSTMKNQALFTAYFYGGVARYLMAAYFGISPTRGGMAIAGGPFIPSDSMFQLAVDRFNMAEKYCANTDHRVNQSFLCRTLMMAGRYKEAYKIIDNTLTLSEPPFVMRYSTALDNFWIYAAGRGRMQWAMDDRFKKYVDLDINDTNRIKIESVQGVSGTKYYIRQILYPLPSSSVVAMSWQECFLMAAELILRQDPNKKQDALDNFNFVRDSHFLPNVEDITLDSIYSERDKELNCTGNRLLDQRRFNRWHLPAGTWQYLPITNGERSRNPNLH